MSLITRISAATAVLLMALLSTAALAQSIGLMNGYAPLTDYQRQTFNASEEDPAGAKLLATEERLQGRHYVTCDEWYLHKFADKIKGLGGGYAGVGTDQAYLFLGWQRPHLAWLFDYDPWVVYIHHAYGVFFREAETIEQFLALWSKDNRKSSIALLKEKLADHPDRKIIITVFKHNRSTIDRRLSRVIRKLKNEGVSSYLSDPEEYTFVRDLITAGRVRPMVGNLLGSKGLFGLAATARTLAVPLRVLYVSNAEGYWKYTPEYRANIIGQYFDDKSLFLRTVAAKWTNGDYRYNIQKAFNFQEWLKHDWVTSYRQIVPRTKLKGKGDIPLTYVDKDPATVKRKK
jgi:hypothetical protein